MIMTYD